MSELAKQEADRVEGEEPDEETAEPEPDNDDTPEQQPEPEQEPAEQLTEQAIEKRYDKASKAAERYAKQVQEILGPTLMRDMVASPLDMLPGFVLVGPDGQPDPETRLRTLAFLGQEGLGKYRQHPDTITCELCDGEGDVTTGAKRKGNELVECPRCKGYGYTASNGMPVGGAAVGANGAAALSPGGPVTPQSYTGGLEPHAPLDPRIAELRAEGFTVLEPIRVNP